MTAEWTDLGLADTVKRLQSLDTLSVRVGVIGQGAQKLEPTGITVGEASFINEFGAPRAGIEPRPFVGPALSHPMMQPIAKGVVQSALDEASAHVALSQAGKQMVSLVRAKLSEITAAGGNQASTIRKKGIDTPLHDTGNLAEAISYEVVSAESELEDGLSIGE